MIVDAIERYLNGDRIEIPEGAMSAALAATKESLLRNFGAFEEEDRKGLHASSPMYCRRRVLFGMRGAYREPIRGRGRITLAYGNSAETIVVLAARLALPEGVVLYPTLAGEQRSGQLMVAGAVVNYHMDLLIQSPDGKRIPYEVKSMNSRSFGEFKKAILDPRHPWHEQERFGYKGQLGVYVKAEEAPYGGMIGFCKDTGHLAEMICPRDLAWEAEYESRVKAVMASLMDGSVPDRPPFATSEIMPGANERPDGTKGPVEEIKHWRCGYCPFVKACWPGFDCVPLASGPKWRKAVSA